MSARVIRVAEILAVMEDAMQSFCRTHYDRGLTGSPSMGDLAACAWDSLVERGLVA